VNGVVTVEIPAGVVTVLLGTEPDRRRLLAALSDTSIAAPGARRAVFRRVVASPALPVVKRVVLLLNAADADVDLVLVDRATEGLDAADRRFFLDHLRLVTARGVAVAVDDTDPVAALAVGDRSLRLAGGGEPELADLDRLPLTA
jgi:hypothetical protein